MKLTKLNLDCIQSFQLECKIISFSLYMLFWNDRWTIT
uniref:Uncharacterized protein n=1 Tax=Arundo donax TaxID=35708 RepID=A0A0A9H2L8_ARUDO